MMTHILRWPDEFSDATPVTDFGDALTEFLDEMIELGSSVSATESWTSFAIWRGARMVDLIRRGKLGFNRQHCWEVRLFANGETVALGPIFELREHACVVIAGIDDLRAVTTPWLAGENVELVISQADFWDKMDTSHPLRPYRGGRMSLDD